MGGIGSGRKPEVFIDETAKKLIKAMRTRGYSWTEIAKDLGYNTATPLDDFRRKNPDFDNECAMIYAQYKMSLHERYVEAALPKNGPAIAAMANRLAERHGIINAEKPSTAIQINQGEDSGIKVCFVKPQELTQGDVIDVPQAD